MSTATNTIEEFASREYEHGFVTPIEADAAPPGLSEEIIRFISARKHEPDWLLEWRLKAYRHWQTLEEPRWWPNVTFPPVNYQDIIYYSAPKQKAKLASLKVGIGYPDTWRDYAGLQIVRGDVVGNARRASLFDYEVRLQELGRPPDRGRSS